MADTTINVNSGFYNAINDDRTYYAEDMNRPYRRLVSNGVFATNRGTPSTDFQVLPGGGMTVTVAPGEGIFANKWLENPSTISFTVPSVSGLRSRIDSVIIQVDERNAGRVGSIVYRTGTAAASPVAPAINEVANVTEYRLANVLVSPLSTSTGIQAADITDFRGSADCPWVTALIQQPDTDSIWQQYQQSVADVLELMDTEFTTALQAKEAEWTAFFQDVESDIGASMNLLVLKNTVVVSSETTTVSLGIPSYTQGSDILEVYINGLMAMEGDFWSTNGTTVTFANAIGTGGDTDRVDFIVYKAVTSVGATIESMINQLETRFANENEDTGWIELTTTNGTSRSGVNQTCYRRIGNRCYVRGSITGVTETATALLLVPSDSWPDGNWYKTTAVLRDGTTAIATATLQLDQNGIIWLRALSGQIQETDDIPVTFEWLRD